MGRSVRQATPHFAAGGSIVTWGDEALCKGRMELFYPTPVPNVVPDYSLAAELCAACPVRHRCRAEGDIEERRPYGGESAAI